MKKCYIVGAGEFSGFIMPDEGDFVIAADGGCDSLLRVGVKPHLVIGDFDSAESLPQEAEIIRYSPQKDETDTFLAAKKALELGFRELWFFGCLGGRPDHSAANIQNIAHFSKLGISCTMFAEKYIITAITDSKISFDSSERGRISVFSFDDTSYKVNIRGLKYTLSDASLHSVNPVGVSNEFTGEKSQISVESGTLIIIKERFM